MSFLSLSSKTKLAASSRAVSKGSVAGKIPEASLDAAVAKKREGRNKHGKKKRTRCVEEKP